MGRRRISERNIRKLTRSGRSGVAVTLPIELIRKLRWKVRQKVTVRKSSTKLIIEDWKK